MNETMASVAGLATAYAAVTSSGFLVAVVLAWVVLLRCSSTPSIEAPQVAVNKSFGRMMLLVEAIDAIPEAMVIAGATADGRMTVSFAISIFMLNVVNTLSSAIDLLASKPERFLHRTLLILIFFSVGSLFFSLYAAVFESFLEHVHRHDMDYTLLLPIMAGIASGSVLIWLLLVAQEHCFTSSSSRTVPAISDPMVAMMEALERERILLATTTAAASVEEEGGGGGASNEPLFAEATVADHKQQTIAYYKDRVSKLENLIVNLQNIGRISDAMRLPVTDDARDVIEEALLDQLAEMHYQTRSLDVTNAHTESFHRRTGRLLLVMLLLAVWTMVLTFALTPLFIKLDSAGHLNAFADGLSGGAFLAVISSTMIPRIQQDAYRSHWSSLTFRSIGMVAFIGGVSVAFLLEFIPSPGPNDRTGR